MKNKKKGITSLSRVIPLDGVAGLILYKKLAQHVLAFLTLY